MSYIGNTPTNQNFVAGSDQFNGTGSQTVFTLSRNVNTVNDIQVVVSNVPQDPFTAYSVSGNSLTFTSAPPSGTGNIYVTYRATNVQTFVPSPGATVGGSFGIQGNLNFYGTGNRITGDFSNATVANRVAFQTSTTNSATSVYILPNGTSPTSQFVAVNNSDPTNASVLQLQVNATDYQIRGGITGTGTYLPMTFYTGGSEAMRIDTSRNVGIGTSSPAQKLDIVGNIAQRGDNTRLLSYKTDGTIIAEQGNGSITGDPNGYGITTRGAFPLLLGTNNTERARIDSSGNLLVGTTSLANNERLRVIGPGAASSEVVRFENSTNASGYSGIVSSIQQNGNNTSTWHFRGNTNAVGNWYLFGNGTTSYSSDARLKKNIETTRSGYIEDLCKLRVVKYNWKNDADGAPKELGLIAQEVEQVFAGLVQDDPSKISEDDDTVYKQIKGSVLPFMLLKAIQELKAELDATKAEIAALKGAA